MRRLTSIDELKRMGRKRRALKRAPKPKVRVDYGRRVRNVTVEGQYTGVRQVLTMPVLPHTGPKPKVYPKVDWTPLAWRVGA
jgi:hypothetical protein